jgi:hypothetical protein
MRQRALVFEMHVLLGPLTLLVGVALMPAVLLGVPQAISYALGPVLRQDPHDLALMTAALPAVFVLSTAWTLGCSTMRGERYRFGISFWTAIHCTLLCAALIGWFADPRAVALFAPVWVFMAHMAWLQHRLRIRLGRR